MAEFEVDSSLSSPDHSSTGSFLPDVLSERMVVIAARFFLEDQIQTDEYTTFREDIHNLYDAEPDDGRLVLAAGLIVARFTIGTNPISVRRPRKSLYRVPQNLLDPYVFTKYQRVGPTIAEMGARVIDSNSSRFDETIYAQVQRTA